MALWRAADPMLPVMAADLGVGLNEIVLVATAYSLPLALVQMILGPVADGLGKTRILRVSVAMVALSGLVIVVAPNFYTVLAGRVIGGMFAGGIGPISLALIGENYPYEKRAVALGRFTVALIGGQMFGAAVSGLLVDHIGWRWVFGIFSLSVAAALALVLVNLKESGAKPARVSFGNFFGSYRNTLSSPGAPWFLGGALLEAVLVLSLIPFVPALMLIHGAEGSSPGGIVIACFAIGGVAFGILVHKVVANLGAWTMMRLGSLAVGAAIILAAQPIHWTWSAGLFFVAGFGFYMMHNPLQLRATELSPHARAAGVSTMAVFFGGGQGIGPVIWGSIEPYTGVPALFTIAGVLTPVLMWVVVAKGKRSLARR